MLTGVSHACCVLLLNGYNCCYMQEVAKILSDALPEYNFEPHEEGEKRQYCDNSKVTYMLELMPVASDANTCSDASISSTACPSALCSAHHLGLV